MTLDLKHTRLVDSGLSFTAHALLLGLASLTFMSAPSFSVSQGDAPMEVHLVSSAAETPERPSSRRMAMKKNEVGSADAMVSASEAESNSSVSVQSGEGSESVAKPNYAVNPPPVYPERARAMDQQGIVLLSVDVTAEGRVRELSVKQSSGFPLLDQAALRAVKNWVFEPAQMGGVKVDARVEVPVRFQIVREG